MRLTNSSPGSNWSASSLGVRTSLRRFYPGVRAESMRFLLDTDICIYVINERPPEVLAQFLAHEDEGIAISVVTASELYWGVRKSGSRRNLGALENFLAPLAVMDFDLAAA